MRARSVGLVAVLVLPVALSAQLRPPRGERGKTPANPAPLPPTAPGVARSVAYQQARWSIEGYSMVSSMDIPMDAGGTYRSATFGTGTHGDYRFSDRLSATVDLTYSFLGSAGRSQTAELGTRLRPMGVGPGVRPFLDLRAGYMNVSDTMFAAPPGFGNQQLGISRYSRGFGGIVGAGLDIPVRSDWGITTGVSAMRNRMTVYRSSNPTVIPKGSDFSMTAFRFAVGIKYSPLRAVALSQNPRQ